MSLIEKLRKSRETLVPAGGYEFTIRRPTDLEVHEYRNLSLKFSELLKNFVVNWNLTELDIVPGGTGVAVVFSSELFMEWVADRDDLWDVLVKAILESYETHRVAQEAALGKPDAG